MVSDIPNGVNAINGINGTHSTPAATTTTTITADDTTTELWRHPSPSSTQMHAFKELINAKYGLRLDHYEDLHKWSVDNIGAFWSEVWDFTGIKGMKVDEEVCDKGFLCHVVCV